MKPNELCDAIIRCLRADNPAFIWGPPGIGKTQIIHELIGPRIELPVWDFRTNSKEPVDLRGLPFVHDARTDWATPEDLPCEPVLMFFDEFNTMLPSMHAPCYQVVQEKKLGNWTAHPGTRIIAAGNRSEDRTVAHRMPTALLTRFLHYDAEVDVEAWCKWGASSKEIDPIMLGFIRWRPHLLHDFNPDARTSPIPRTVHMANKVMRQNPPASTMHTEIAAACGDGFATEFVAFVRHWQRVPDLDKALADPHNYPIPDGKDGLSVRFATAAALSHKLTRENTEAAIVYLTRLGEELSVFALRDALSRDKSLVDGNRHFTKWAQEHHDLIA